MSRLSKIKKQRNKRKYTKKQKGGAAHFARVARAVPGPSLGPGSKRFFGLVKSAKQTLSEVSKNPGQRLFESLKPNPGPFNTPRASQAQNAAKNAISNFLKKNPNLGKSTLGPLSVSPNHRKSKLANKIMSQFSHQS